MDGELRRTPTELADHSAVLQHGGTGAWIVAAQMSGTYIAYAITTPGKGGAGW